MTKNLIIYIHGKGGSSSEAEHYRSLFPNADVIGFDYKSETPWEAQNEFVNYFDTVSAGYDKVYIIANSIGAFYSLYSLGCKKIEKAFFISPVVNMEKLICNMLVWANATEEELMKKGEIEAPSGIVLSWEYLSWIRNHPINWNIPTAVLYGENDNLQSFDTINAFSKTVGAAVSVMKNGEHWFHTPEQMAFLDDWITKEI